MLRCHGDLCASLNTVCECVSWAPRRERERDTEKQRERSSSQLKWHLLSLFVFLSLSLSLAPDPGQMRVWRRECCCCFLTTLEQREASYVVIFLCQVWSMWRYVCLLRLLFSFPPFLNLLFIPECIPSGSAFSSAVTGVGLSALNRREQRAQREKEGATAFVWLFSRILAVKFSQLAGELLRRLASALNERKKHTEQNKLIFSFIHCGCVNPNEFSFPLLYVNWKERNACRVWDVAAFYLL